MKEENKNIEELNEMVLLKLIYEIVKENSENIKKLEEKFKYLDEKIDTVYKELNEKIDTVYKELNEKFNSEKNTLVKEIAEEFKNITTITTENINRVEKKIDNEIEDRKIEFCKVKDFNKIIINDIRSRVSILEEETEKYNLK